MSRELRVVRIADGEVVKRIAVSPYKSERHVEKIMMGLLRNMSEEYRVEDSAGRRPVAAGSIRSIR